MPRLLVVLACTVLAAELASARALRLEEARAGCGVASSAVAAPRAAANRLPDSEVAHGSRGIRHAWLGSPTTRYTHAALGARTHAGSLHAVVATPAGDREVVLRLPDDRVFEDRQVRLVDLDRDGRDELVVVQAQADTGGALVVYGIDGPAAAPRLVERARGPHVGTLRWLNPVGAADFDGDGKLELVSVSTPHIGGVLTLYRYAPPALEPVAQEGNVSNHRYGAVEQRLAVILQAGGGAPSVLVPDRSRRGLRLLGREGDGWRELAPAASLPARAERVVPHAGGACVELEGGRWIAVAG